MRASMFLTRELAARTVARGENIDTTCRGCHVAVESQSHILGKCRATQAERVNRHNSVCAYIARRLRTGSGTGARSIVIHREHTITIDPGEIEGLTRRILLKPDVVITNTRIVILEVSVVYESHRVGEIDPLRRVRREKMNKYDILKRVLAARFGKPVSIRTLIVGCRGGWLATNNKLFKDLGVSFSVLDRNACVERAVWGSILTFNRFLHHTREAPHVSTLGTSHCCLLGPVVE